MNFEYKKGNMDMQVYKSEKPIPKEMINERILNYLYEKSGENKDLLKISDFSMEFLLFGGVKGFFKFEISSGNKNAVEVLLTGEDLIEAIKIIKEHGSGFDMGSN
jgi:hypothetical protein